MVSTAAPSRTMRPRRASAFTANGRMVSSLPICSGSRTGMARSGLVIAPEYRRGRRNLEALFPGRSAARSDALQTRDRYILGVWNDPGSAAHRFALRRVREMKTLRPISLQTPRQNPLLRVQPVLGLVEHHRLRAVDHFVGDLLAAMGRQTMHEDSVGLGAGHQPRIDLVALEQVMAPRAVAVAHGDPGIGHDAVGALDRFFRVGADADLGARRFYPF